MLHLIQKSPFQNHCLQDCLNIAAIDDQFLLLQDGVYALQKPDFINLYPHIFVLKDDLKARGIPVDSITHKHVKAIDYAEFVQLTLDTNKTLSWY